MISERCDQGMPRDCCSAVLPGFVVVDASHAGAARFGMVVVIVVTVVL